MIQKQSDEVMTGDLHRFEAPFDPLQVWELNRFQYSGIVQPFTCPEGDVLIAYPEGWFCPGCSFKMDWAWKEMRADPCGGVMGHA